MFQWLSQVVERLLDFSAVLNTSIAASWLVLAVLILRVVLKKAPKWLNAALWGLVALRLILPFSIKSNVSLIPSAETVTRETMTAQGQVLHTQTHIDLVSNPVYTGEFTAELQETVGGIQIDMMLFTYIWLIGAGIMAMYTLLSYLRMSYKVGTAVKLLDNIYQSENVQSPFVMGIVKPKIYMPYGMTREEIRYVTAHELAHIERHDHLWKPLGFALLTIHWFNPLMWLSYVLLCRDIELACDEKVIKNMRSGERADYTQTLVALSVHSAVLGACPLAFGEVGVKARVKSVMKYKKPAFWMTAAAVVLCAAVAVCFLTDPIAKADETPTDKADTGLPEPSAPKDTTPEDPGEPITDVPTPDEPKTPEHSDDIDPGEVSPDVPGTGEGETTDSTDEGILYPEPSRPETCAIEYNGGTLYGSLYVGDGFSLYIPDDGWELQESDNGETLIWERPAYPGVKIIVRRYPGKTDYKEIVAGEIAKYSPEFNMYETKRGVGGSDDDVENYIGLEIYDYGDGGYIACGYQILMEAWETYGTVARVSADTFQVTEYENSAILSQ